MGRIINEQKPRQTLGFLAFWTPPVVGLNRFELTVCMMIATNSIRLLRRFAAFFRRCRPIFASNRLGHRRIDPLRASRGHPCPYDGVDLRVTHRRRRREGAVRWRVGAVAEEECVASAESAGLHRRPSDHTERHPIRGGSAITALQALPTAHRRNLECALWPWTAGDAILSLDFWKGPESGR